MPFDRTAAASRLDTLWQLKARFGMERGALYTYLNELVSDRYALVRGMHLLRDELQLASATELSDIVACGADLSLPSVVTTLAHTNCGDRIHQGEATSAYEHLVAGRFATMSEIGELKLEAFSPAGGGTDDGPSFAHVTVAHQVDPPLRRRIYDGNAQSFVLVNLDLMTHTGRMDEGGKTTFGYTRESPWREPRAACGAIVGVLERFNAENPVHRRLRSDLGEANYRLLTEQGVTADDGTDVTAAVAAAIVAVSGMRTTADALASELDERGVGHLSATVTVNLMSRNDTVIYLARSTVFQGEIVEQGLGTDAAHYAASLVPYHGERRLMLRTCEGGDYPVTRRRGASAPR